MSPTAIEKAGDSALRLIHIAIELVGPHIPSLSKSITIPPNRLFRRTGSYLGGSRVKGHRNSSKECHIVLYKKRGEPQWIVRHGWIRIDDGKSLRRYLETWPICQEAYVIVSEPRNNALHLLSEIQSDLETPDQDDACTLKRRGERKAILEHMLKRGKINTEDEERTEAVRRQEFRQILQVGRPEAEPPARG